MPPDLQVIFDRTDFVELAARARMIREAGEAVEPKRRHLFSVSRERKARLMDGLGVVLLLLVSAFMGVALVLLSTGSAKADAAVDDYATRYASAICATIDTYHSGDGVVGVARGIMRDGFTAEQAVEVINEAVFVWCPRNWPLLQAIGAQARSVNA